MNRQVEEVNSLGRPSYIDRQLLIRRTKREQAGKPSPPRTSGTAEEPYPRPGPHITEDLQVVAHVLRLRLNQPCR
jgi:hypothetical protein